MCEYQNYQKFQYRHDITSFIIVIVFMLHREIICTVIFLVIVHRPRSFKFWKSEYISDDFFTIHLFYINE